MEDVLVSLQNVHCVSGEGTEVRCLSDRFWRFPRAQFGDLPGGGGSTSLAGFLEPFSATPETRYKRNILLQDVHRCRLIPSISTMHM